MKKISLIMIFLVMISTVNAINWCGIEVSPLTECMESTPVLGTCGTYNVKIYSPSNSLLATKTMTQISTSGTYNFSFNSSFSGMHKWITCDNTSGTINVRTDLHDQLNNNVSTIVSTISSSENNIKSNVSLEATRIITVGYANWNTSTAITATVNNTAIALAVWDYNVTGYSSLSNVDKAGYILYWLWSVIF